MFIDKKLWSGTPNINSHLFTIICIMHSPFWIISLKLRLHSIMSLCVLFTQSLSQYSVPHIRTSLSLAAGLSCLHHISFGASFFYFYLNSILGVPAKGFRHFGIILLEKVRFFFKLRLTTIIMKRDFTFFPNVSCYLIHICTYLKR